MTKREGMFGCDRHH